jgi:hypothetical protein
MAAVLLFLVSVFPGLSMQLVGASHQILAVWRWVVSVEWSLSVLGKVVSFTKLPDFYDNVNIFNA